MFTTYILKSEKSGRFYVGHTEDVAKRILRHNNGAVTSTKNKGPWKLVYTEIYESREMASAREKEIKSKKSRQYIIALLNADGGIGRHVPN